MYPFGAGTSLYSNAAVTNTKIDAVTFTNAVKKIVCFECFNADATNFIFVQFFDATAANVNLGTTVPKFVLGIPPKGSVFGRVGAITFATNICIVATSTATGNAAPATAQIVQFEYI